MSQHQPINGDPVVPRRPNPFGQISRSPAVQVIGLPELIGLIGAAFLAVVVVFAYLYFYMPANSQRVALETERTRLQGLVQSERAKISEDDTTSQTVAQINTSVENFEGNWLASPSSGRMSLYTVLNELMKNNGLRNTAGPTYSQLEVLGTKAQVQPGITAEKQSVAKWQSIYPGIAVSVTVEGWYPNIRHFIRDIEMSRQFLIINAVELEGVKQSNVAQDLATVRPESLQPKTLKNNPKAPPNNPTAPPPEISGGRGGLVSLRLDLATYFQRAESKPPATN